MKRSMLWLSLFSLLALALLARGGQLPVPAPAAAAQGRQSVAQSVRPSPGIVNLSYHGGPVMVGTVTVYAIFWEPPGFYVSPTYNSLILRYFHDVGRSPLYHDLKQYDDARGKYPVTSVLGGSWTDAHPYPGNKLKDADTQHEVEDAIQVNGWTPSLHTLFIVLAAKGEIMCANGGACSFVSSLCAYHYHIGTATIYAAEPYAGTDLSSCGVPSSPNHDIDADSTINLITHEQFESTTDPLNTAWWGTSPTNDEIGDRCVWQFGSPNKYGGDVIWRGHPYEVQKEWDNANRSCVLRGP